MVKMIIWLIAAVLILFVAVTTYLYFYQKNFVYFPSADIANKPEAVGLEYEDVRIMIRDGEEIHGWYIPSQTSNDSARKVVLFCHGNAGNISHRLPTAVMFAGQKIDLLMFDYRGYGLSDGEPGEQATYEDALGAYKWLIDEKKYKPSDIILFGRSLGGAVSIDLAGKVKCGGIIVESAFTSAVEVGKKAFPILPIGLLLKHRYDSIGKISTIDCPKLFVHSPQDDIIPYEMGRALFETAQQPKAFYDIFGRHNDRGYLDDEAYIKTVRDFILPEGSISK